MSDKQIKLKKIINYDLHVTVVTAEPLCVMIDDLHQTG